MPARPGLPLRSPVRRTLIAVACLAAAPTLRAQQPATPAGGAPAADSSAARPATHTVKRGDTLWDLANRYLGDPFRWPDLYRINTDQIDDPHWIYPGEVLKLPGAQEPAPSDTSAEEAVRDTTGAQNAGDTVATVRAAPSPTVFATRSRERGQFVRSDTARRPAVPAALLPSVPFMDREGGPEGAGRIAGSAEAQEGSIEQANRTPQIRELLVVVPPRATTPRVGDQYVAYTLGPERFGVGQLVLPTALLRVEEVRAGSVTARLMTSYDRPAIGQAVVPLIAAPPPAGVRPVPVSNGLTTEVVAVVSAPALPSLQNYVMLRASERDGLRTGDLVSLVRPAYRDDDGVQHPEEELGTAEVVKVTPRGTTAMIVAQRSSAIGEGTTARLVARMPR